MGSSCRNKKIGIFGGSFDPIHNGHLHVIDVLHNKLQLDLVILVPNFQSPWKGDSQVSFADRMALCQLAVQELPWCEVSDIESRLPIPSYTIQTIETLQEELMERFGAIQLYFAIGDDQAQKLQEWKNIDMLSRLVTFAVVKRENVALDCPYPHVQLEAAAYPASSTDIRNGDFRELPAAVRHYILEHDLYLQDILQRSMSEKRYQHTKSVCQLALSIARKHHLNLVKVRLAADLHDIAKEFPKNKMEQYMEQEPPEHQAMPYAVHHQYAGARYVGELLGITDSDVLEAIRYHSTGGANPYVQVLFVADKIEPLRGYDVSEELELVMHDLNAGYMLVKKKQKEFMKEIDKHDIRTID